MAKLPRLDRCLGTVLIAVGFVLGGLGTAWGDQHGGGHGMHGEGHEMHGAHGAHGQGKAMRGGHGMHGEGKQGHGGRSMHGRGEHNQGGHGRHGGAGRHGAPHLYADDWRESLTDQQKQALDRLHVEYARTKAPRKAQIQALKVELATLATAEELDSAEVDAKIDELLTLEQAALRARYAYLAAQRQVLTNAQRISFDMQAIHNAMHGGKGRHGGGRH